MKSFSDQFSVTQGETSVNVKEEKVHLDVRFNLIYFPFEQLYF